MPFLAPVFVGLLPAAPALAQADVAPGAPTFRYTIPFEEIESLKPFLPPEFWDDRDFFFDEGMQLEIGNTNRDASEPAVFDIGRQTKGR